MKEAFIEDIAYQLKRNKDNGLPGAIVFLGAGASVTAGIPQASKIASDILEKFSDAPSIKKLADDNRHYHNLMGCITSSDRRSLLAGYLKDAKINVSHIYLAHLMMEGYVDYIVTVNFDNLSLRALALFNLFPAVYDISILRDITTTSFDKPAVIFMHGQYHGLWQLNTGEEMEKINQTAPHIFRSIAHQRPWVVVGYGANDPVFNHMVNLGRFDNNLYWIGYKGNEPASHIKESLLDRSNSDALWVKDFDSDLFFLRLHTELNLDQPEIFSKPFSHLKKLHKSIIDIQDENLKAVKERLGITGSQIDDAINKYEMGENNRETDKDSKKEDLLRLEIINNILKDDFSSTSEIEEKILKSPNPSNYSELLSDYYNNWGNFLTKLAKGKKGVSAEQLYLESIQKYLKATELRPDSEIAFYNFGTALSYLANFKSGEECEKLHSEAIGKFRKATELKPTYATAFNNWGFVLSNLAKTKQGKEAEILYLEAIEKNKKATELNPNLEKAFNNWGISLVDLGELMTKDKKELFFNEGVEKFKKAIELNPDYVKAYSNLGCAFSSLSKIKKGEDALRLRKESIETLLKGYQLGSIAYNLACVYALDKKKEDALKYLEISFQRSEFSYKEVLDDSDWDFLKKDEDFIQLIEKYKL